jgi:hypothetical protein
MALARTTVAATRRRPSREMSAAGHRPPGRAPRTDGEPAGQAPSGARPLGRPSTLIATTPASAGRARRRPALSQCANCVSVPSVPDHGCFDWRCRPLRSPPDIALRRRQVASIHEPDPRRAARRQDPRTHDERRAHVHDQGSGPRPTTEAWPHRGTRQHRAASRRSPAAPQPEPRRPLRLAAASSGGRAPSRRYRVARIPALRQGRSAGDRRATVAGEEGGAASRHDALDRRRRCRLPDKRRAAPLVLAPAQAPARRVAPPAASADPHRPRRARPRRCRATGDRRGRSRAASPHWASASRSIVTIVSGPSPSARRSRRYRSIRAARCSKDESSRRPRGSGLAGAKGSTFDRP